MSERNGRPCEAGTGHHHELLTWASQVSLLVAVYFVTGHLGLQLAHDKEGFTLVWAPTVSRSPHSSSSV